MSSRTLFVFALFLSIGTFSRSLWAALPPSQVQQIAITPGGSSPIPTSNYAASGISLSDLNVAFVGTDSNSASQVYAQSSGGTILITITGSNFRTTPVGPISIGAGAGGQSTVVFRGIDPSPNGSNSGIFAAPASGGVIITIIGSNFSNPNGAPATSRTGNSVAFQDVNSTTNAIYVGPANGTIPLTITGTNFGRPAVNSSGTVVFAGSPSGAAAGVYVEASNGGIRGTIPDLSTNLRNLHIIDNPAQSVFFEADDSGTPGNEAIYRSDGIQPRDQYGNPKLLFSRPAGSTGEPFTFSVNSSGELLVDDQKSILIADDGSGTGIPPVDSTLISVGDPLGGSSVTSLGLSETGLLDSGNVVFFATLADGSSGYFFASVPEPSTLAALLLPAGAALLRRRQHCRVIA
jgi:hypothetical protein